MFYMFFYTYASITPTSNETYVMQNDTKRHFPIFSLHSYMYVFKYTCIFVLINKKKMALQKLPVNQYFMRQIWSMKPLSKLTIYVCACVHMTICMFRLTLIPKLVMFMLHLHTYIYRSPKYKGS